MDVLIECGAERGLRTEALAQVGLFVDEDFGGDHVSERHEHLQDVLVPEFLGKVIDKEVGTFWTWKMEEGDITCNMVQVGSQQGDARRSERLQQVVVTGGDRKRKYRKSRTGWREGKQ